MGYAIFDAGSRPSPMSGDKISRRQSSPDERRVRQPPCRCHIGITLAATPHALPGSCRSAKSSTAPTETRSRPPGNAAGPNTATLAMHSTSGKRARAAGSRADGATRGRRRAQPPFSKFHSECPESAMKSHLPARSSSSDISAKTAARADQAGFLSLTRT